MIWRLFIMLAFATVWASNISEIHITDESGAPFPNVLVIIKSLDDNVEVGRYISDRDGQIPPINFSHSLYRVIATCPYGLCRTTVREFLGSNMPAKVILKVPVNSSDLNGEIVGAPKVPLVLETSDGKAAIGAKVLIRDPKARWEHWYLTDKSGKANLDMVTDPAVLVIVYAGKIWRQEVATRCPAPPVDTAAECKEIERSRPMKLRLPG